MEKKRSCYRVDEQLFGVVKYYQNKGETVRKVAALTGLGESTVQELYNAATYQERLANLKEKAEKRKLQAMPLLIQATEEAEQKRDEHSNDNIIALLTEIRDELKSLVEIWRG